MVELTRAEVDHLLREQVVGRIGCHADGRTYVVPVVYAYDGEAVYVASIEGRKVEMMRASPSVCFEVDAYSGVGWRSAIAEGVYEELAESEIPAAIALLRGRFAGTAAGVRRRGPGTAGRPTVWFRIALGKVTGRASRR